MTTTQIETHARYLSDTVGDTKWTAATEPLAYTNEGVKSLYHTMVAARNPLIAKTATISITVAGGSSYTLTTIAADFMDIIDVMDTTNYSKLKEISYTEKLSYQDNYYVYYRLGNLIYFCYTPTAARTLQLVYAPTCTALSSGDELLTIYPWLPVMYHELVAYYVALRMIVQDGNKSSVELRADYSVKLQEFREWSEGVTSPVSFSYETYGEGYYNRNLI